MAGFLDGLLGGGGDLYGGDLGDVLSPAQRNAIQARGLLAMAGAFGDAAMPSRLPVPIGAVLGKAAGALGTGQDEAMNAAVKNALTVQQIKAARLKMQQQTDFLNQPSLADVMRRILAGGGPGVSGAGGVPAPGTYAGGDVAGDASAPPDLFKLGSDYASGLSPTPAKATSRFGLGERQYPATPDGGLGVGGGGLLAAPDARLGLQTPTDRYRPGGALDPFANGAPPSDTAGAPKAQATRAADEQAARPESYWGQQRAAGQLQGPLAAGGSGGGAPPVAPPEAGGDEETTAAPTAAPDTVARGNGLLALSPDLYRPVEPTPADAQTRRVLDLIQRYESGGRNINQQVLPAGGGYNPSVGRVTGPSSASGYFQMIDPTWRHAAQLSGIDTSQYPRAIDAPYDLQRQAAAKLLQTEGLAPWAPYNANLRAALQNGGGAPDQVIPPAGGGNLPIMRAQYAPGGGAPAPGGTAAVGGAQVPLPAGVDPARFQALMLELADRSAKAEILGLGNPYGPMLQILQNSPQYQAATEFAKQSAVLPLAQEQARQKALGGYDVDVATRTAQAALDRATKQQEQLGGAALDLTTILVADGKGGTIEKQGTRAQAVRAANGLAVPELGIPGLVAPASATPAGEAPGAGAAPQAQGPVAGVSSAVPGQVVGKQYFTPGQTAEQTAEAEGNVKRAQGYRDAADAAANTKATLQRISSQLATVDWRGPPASWHQLFASYARMIDPSYNRTVSSYEEANSTVNELVRQAVKASDPNPTFLQTKMAIDAMPTPLSSPEGAEKISNRMIGLQNYTLARAQALDQYKADHNSYAGFDTQWRNQVSPFAFVVTRMKPDEKAQLRDYLNQTNQGKYELDQLIKQTKLIDERGYVH